MKISWNHLQSFFADKLDKEFVLERLTMAGLEVEDETPVAPVFSGIVIGEVMECIKHPDADKLSLCKVNVAEAEPLQIICGASNVAVGVKIPCAKVGAVLPGDFKITERKMRGIVSYGMLCSGDEIGCPSDVDGLLLLDADAPVGKDVREYLDLDDSIIEFKITPNRGDCLSYRGLAREVAALTGNALKPAVNIVNSLNKLSDTLKLEVLAVNECPHYVGLVIKNIDNKITSPSWLIRILERSGVRSISPLVDIANYVMLLLGQPLHTFDLTKVASGVKVRMATSGEELKLIDASTAKLQTNTLIIADGENKPVAIAGVMGSLDSGVSADTTALLLESAFFAPDIIQGKAKFYGVSSDAAFRFERGVDPEIQHDAINLAAQLVVDICGGAIGEYIHFSNNSAGAETQKINLSFKEIELFIGQSIPVVTIIQILTNLGCICDVNGDLLVVTPPSYRFDLRIKQDIIEEIIRVYGYDRIEAKMPILEHSLEALDPKLQKIANLKQTMVAYGFSEIISYAFIEEKYANLFSTLAVGVVRLQNPIAGLNVMRSNLLSGLIKSLQYNVNRGQDSVRLFELARVFHGETIDAQPLYLAGLIYGKYVSSNWALASREVDFYDLSLVLQELLAAFGKVELRATGSSGGAEYMHPGRTANVLLNGNQIGYICQLHPALTGELGLESLPYVFEVNIESISLSEDISLNTVSKFQKVSRDLAFVLDKKIEVGAILQRISQLKINELISFNVFDIFSGGSLSSNEKSVALNFVFQSDKTLSDEDVNPALELVKNLVVNEFNGNLR